MAKEFITAGYLDVKISAKAKRGFTPWKAWKKLWCELKKIDNIDNGLEIKLKSSAESNSVNCFVIPRNATICRTESRTKQFSFGIFGPDRCHKPLLFLSGVSESDSQLWMVSIRRMLSIASHLPVPDGSYYVSLVDNDYSRVAGLTGLHGNLSTNSREVTIKDPFTGDTRTTLPWYQLHQFHLAATGSTDDEKKIVVMHTSKEFRSGPGQLHLFCLKAPEVLESLMTRGKIPRIYVNSFMDTRRFSRSDGDLRESENSISNPADSPSSPVYYRSHSGSDDSGVRVSMASDDSTLVLKCKKAASLISLGFGLLMATPGGSEIDTESSCDLLENEEQCISSQFINIAKRGIDDPRRESGISVMSGVYEEIPDLPSTPSNDDKIIVRQSVHTYEDPIDIILTSVTQFSPPPLPPRRELFRHNSFSTTSTTSTSFSTGCASPPSTPADGLTEKSTLIDTLVPICESEYMVMTPAKPQAESIYLSMSQGQPTELEDTYMVMSGKGTTNN